MKEEIGSRRKRLKFTQIDSLSHYELLDFFIFEKGFKNQPHDKADPFLKSAVVNCYWRWRSLVSLAKTLDAFGQICRHPFCHCFVGDELNS